MRANNVANRIKVSISTVRWRGNKRSHIRLNITVVSQAIGYGDHASAKSGSGYPGPVKRTTSAQKGVESETRRF